VCPDLDRTGVLVGSLPLPEDNRAGPDAKEVAERKKGQNDTEQSHCTGLLAAASKVAMRKQCVDPLCM
jgi:hypothetical protein